MVLAGHFVYGFSTLCAEKLHTLEMEITALPKPNNADGANL
jgi:hypothetical protein